MFIRKKNSGYYLIENTRIAGRVRQKVIAYLGRCSTIDQTIETKRKQCDELRRKIGEDYDERTYRDFWTHRIGKQVERELKSYSLIYSRQHHPLPRDGSEHLLIEDALAAIKNETTVWQEWAGRTRDVYWRADHPRIAFMVARYKAAKQKHFADLHQKLHALDQQIARLEQLQGKRNRVAYTLLAELSPAELARLQNGKQP